MNIDEYLEIKNAEPVEEKPDAQVEHQTAPVVEENIQEAPEASEIVQPEGIEQTQTEVDALPQPQTETQQVNFDEYQKAQQELERLRGESATLYKQNQQARIAQEYYNKMMEDPGYAKVFAEKNGLQYVDPAQQAVVELEQKYNDLLLEREIENMQIKYKDFDPQQVIQLAVNKGINSLEDAYLLSKVAGGSTTAPSTGTIDPVSLKEQIRQEVLNELQSNVDTSSMIGASGGGTKRVTENTPQLTQAEKRVAQNMKMTDQEYLKWKNIK